MKFFIELLTEAIENAGYKVYPYSGRGMMGKQCLAFTIQEPTTSAIVKVVWTIEDEELRLKVGDILASALTDNMGKGTVVYLPRYEV